MAEMEGKTLKSGVAIAAGAVVRMATGISGISPDILQQGVDALRKKLPPKEYPEVVAVCDTLAAGISIQIPGVNIIAVAAESAEIPDGAEPEVPCIVGLPRLLDAVSAGQIVIVDADRGIVQIDPDPKALIAYQQRDEARNRSRALFIEARHLPAKTQAGEIVSVYARASDEAGLAQAVESGADGLVVEPFEPYGLRCYEAVLRIALGKPTAVLAGSADKDLLRAAARLAGPDQIRVLFPAAYYAALSRRMADAIEYVRNEVLGEDLELPRIAVGTIASTAAGAARTEHERVFHLVDLRSHGPARVKRVEAEEWIAALGADRLAFDIGSHSKQAKPVVEAGARYLVTIPGLVARVKDAIREIAGGAVLEVAE